MGHGRSPGRVVALLVALVAALTTAGAVDAVAPRNDRFAAALPLTGERGEVRSSNVDAGAEAGEPPHAGESAVRSVWFRWTAPATAAFAIDTCGSSFDTVLAVYVGTTLASLQSAASDDDGCGVASAVMLAAEEGRSYAIAVDGYEGESGTIELHWSRVEPPPNDAFAAAAPLEGTGGEATGTVAGASREPGEPADVGPLHGSVWYAWRPPSDGFAVVSVPAASFDSSLAVYVGDSPVALQLVRAAAPADVRTAEVAFDVRGGAVYRIAVRGVAALGGGRFTLRWARPQPPENDRPELARFVSGETGATTVTTFGAAVEGPERPPHPELATAAGSAWFAWRPPRDGPAVVQVCGGSGIRGVAVFTGDALDPAARAGVAAGTCGQARVAFSATAGALVRVAVVGTRERAATLTLTWGFPPANDDLARAQDLDGAPRGAITGTTAGSTLEHEEPVPDDPDATGSVWYAWRAAATGWTTFDTCGSSFDTILALYTGDVLPGLAQLATDDDACGSGASLIRFRVERGVVYRIAVRGFGGDAGSFALRWGPSPPPANDAFARAATLRGARGAVAGTTLGTNREAGEPVHLRRTGGTAWYRWVAPAGRWYVFETCGSTFDTVLAVYRGRALGRLATVGVSDDDCRGQSLVRFPAQRGGEYRLAVTGYGRQAAFRLAWRAIAPPPCVVPSVVGRRLPEARRLLEAAYCRLGTIRVVPLELVPAGTVLGQEPGVRRGVRRPHGTPVRLEVAGPA